jgi:hypothetical protein
MRAVLCAGVAATLLLGVTLSAQGQDTSQPQAHDSIKVALIHQLLTTTHSVDLAISAIESGASAQRAANPRIPAVFWDRFLAEARNRRGELEDMIVDVYERHFSADELRQLISFYQTPVGQKMISELPAVFQESSQAGRQWGGRLGASIATQLESEGIRFTP